jgi:hypothetical protein
VDDLSRFYPDHSAWGDNSFYEVGPNSRKWLVDPTLGIAYVNWGNLLGALAEGSSLMFPFTTIVDAYTHKNFIEGSWIFIWPGDYPEKITLSKASTLRAIGGPVTIGKQTGE